MTSTIYASEIFKELRPLCVEIAQEPTSCRLDALRDFMQSNSSSDFSMLVEYILFPLQATVTRKNTSMKLKIQALGCICVLVSKTGLSRFDLFQQIFRHVCLLLSSKEPGKVSTSITEDSKEVLLDCLLVLLDVSTCEVLECTYKDDFMPSLGHCVTLLLNIAVNDKAKSLVVKATKIIRKFVFVSNMGTKEDSNKFNAYEKLLSTKLASFLPGISISLSKVITGGISRGQTVIISALEAWTAHLNVVMNNKFFPGTKLPDSLDQLTHVMLKLMPAQKDNPNPNTCDKKPQEPEEEKCLDVKKDHEWFVNTAAKLKILIERVASLAGHSSWKVRLALVEYAYVLLKDCSMALEVCVPCLFEIVIGLSSDEYVEVSKRSNDVVLELSALLENSDRASIAEIIEEKLYSHFSALPRKIRGTDEGMKLRILRIIVGCLGLLGDRLKTTLNSGYLLKRMSQALIQVLEFDLSDIRIVEQKTFQDTTSEKDFGEAARNDVQFIYKKNFLHFRDENILSAIKKICWYLGNHGNLVLLVDHFLELFRSSSANRKQVVFLINEIVRGSGGIFDQDFSTLKDPSNEGYDTIRMSIKLVLNDYLSRDIWKLRISNDESTRSGSQKDDFFKFSNRRVLIPRQSISFSELNSNVQLCCLLLEGIGFFASVLHEQFESMLLDILYPLMEKLGSRNATVSQVASWSLGTIAICCKYESTEELIARNVDYLINSISLNLRHIKLNPDTPAVLNAMLQYGNQDLLPYLEDTLDEVLNVIDYSDNNFLLSLVKVLNSLTVALSKWFPVDTMEKNTRFEEESVNSVQEELRDFFLAQLKLKKESLGDVVEDDVDIPEPEDDHELNDEGKDKELPLHIKVTEKILEKCTYFLTSKFATVQLVILDTIQHGVIVLSNTEDHLLPMLHKLWTALTKCFADEQLVVRTKALSVLQTMVHASGQFLRRRVVKDTFPVLVSYLVKQQSTSAKAGPLYYHTLAFKFQLAVLNVIGVLCRDLEILDIECNRVMSAIIPYLSQKQPLKLQEAAINAMKMLNELEPDLVWLSLNERYCSCDPKLPSFCSSLVFRKVQFADLCSKKNEEYAVNVQKLLKN